MTPPPKKEEEILLSETLRVKTRIFASLAPFTRSRKGGLLRNVLHLLHLGGCDVGAGAKDEESLLEEAKLAPPSGLYDEILLLLLRSLRRCLSRRNNQCFASPSQPRRRRRRRRRPFSTHKRPPQTKEEFNLEVGENMRSTRVGLKVVGRRHRMRQWRPTDRPTLRPDDDGGCSLRRRVEIEVLLLFTIGPVDKSSK